MAIGVLKGRAKLKAAQRFIFMVEDNILPFSGHTKSQYNVGRTQQGAGSQTVGDQIQAQLLPNREQAKATLYALVPWSVK